VWRGSTNENPRLMSLSEFRVTVQGNSRDPEVMQAELGELFQHFPPCVDPPLQQGSSTNIFALLLKWWKQLNSWNWEEFLLRNLCPLLFLRIVYYHPTTSAASSHHLYSPLTSWLGCAKGAPDETPANRRGGRSGTAMTDVERRWTFVCKCVHVPNFLMPRGRRSRSRDWLRGGITYMK